jgi:hypothetical protein
LKDDSKNPLDFKTQEQLRAEAEKKRIEDKRKEEEAKLQREQEAKE